MNRALTLLLLLAACNKDAPPPSAPVDGNTTATPTATSAPTSTATATATATASATTPPTGGRARAKEGELCGGIAGIMCEDGLKCVMAGPTHPDQAGTCKK